MQRQRTTFERPLAPRDYDVPVGWWGWSWEPPVPMSVGEIIASGSLDPRTAALLWMVLERHGSLLIAGEQPHSGKTTTLTAVLDFVPPDVRRVFIQGGAETFDYLGWADPSRSILLANEISSHLPVYLWGERATRVFASLERGYAFGSTLHADSADEALAQLEGELGVAPADLARVDLLAVMRLYRDGTTGETVRRIVSLHRIAGRVPLVLWDAADDRHRHDEAAELALLVDRTDADRTGGTAEALALELTRRASHLAAIGPAAIPQLRAAIRAYVADIR